MKKWCVILVGLLAACGMASGQAHYVSHWGSHTAPFSSWETAATNLMDAVNAAPNGSVIWVTNGVYRTGSAVGGGMDSRLALTRRLTVRSVNGYSNTVIEGAFHSAETNIGPDGIRAVYMTNGTLDGFTIRRGATLDAGTEAQISGGGLYAGGGTQLNVRVAGNYGYTAGGAWLQTCYVSNGIFEMNFSETGPRVKVNRQVKLANCKLNNAGMMFPDARILGTNGAGIVNGDGDLNLENGTWFGRVHVATGAAVHVFTVTNQGVRPLYISGFSTNGGHEADFIVRNVWDDIVQPGAETTFEILFDPEEVGIRRTLLFMASNDPDDDPYAVWVSGEGIQAEMRVLATNDHSVITNGSLTPLLAQSTDFGDARVTRDVWTNTFIITNIGSATLNIDEIRIWAGDVADFTVVDPLVYPVSVQTGAVTTFSVAFDPQAPGVRTTLVHIVSDCVDTPYEFMVQGRGVEPEMRVLGTNLAWIANGDMTPSLLDGTDFGVCDADPVRHVFTITNAGTHLLTLTNAPHIVISGDHPDDFYVTLEPASTIGAGGTTTFEIEFFPHVATTRTAIVSIYSDDVYNTNEIYSFAVRGEGSLSNLFIDIRANLHNVGASAMAWGDYNNDGLLDLAVLGYDGANRFTDIYENLGGGKFTNINAGLPQLESGRLAWGDYDNDGWVDLAIMGFGGTSVVTEIWRNQGDGTFSNIQAGLTAVYNGGLDWGDYDNDGDLDLIVAGYTRSNTVTILYRNEGNDVFTPVDAGLLPVRDGRATWVDHDNSGHLDLLITGDDGHQKTTRLYKNYGGSFTNKPLPGVVGVAYGGLGYGDFDRDGDLDLALTGYGPTGMVSHIYKYNGGGTPYARTSDQLEPVWIGDCDWGDFNNNGWLDLIVSGAGTNNSRHVTLYENIDGALTRLNTLIPGMRVSSLAWGDYDNDGDLDLAISGQTTNGYRSFIYRNLAPEVNTPPSAPTGLSAVRVNNNEILFSWDMAADAQTPGQSLTYNLYVGTIENPIAIMSPHADLATGQRRVVGKGNVQMNREWHLKNLPSGEIFWGVQAVDGGYMGGPFATGTPVDIPALPDFVISAIDVMEVPFRASVTVSNQGTSVGSAGRLSVWLHRPAEATCGLEADYTDTSVDLLDPGETRTIIFSGIPKPTNVVTNTFRAYINSVCSEPEANYDNNQAVQVYTNHVYEPFWFNAVGLTNDVYLRWIDPVRVGMQSSRVLLRYSELDYPTNTTEGLFLYEGDDQVHHHTGRTPGQPYFYTIWVTHDELEWLEPPE